MPIEFCITCSKYAQEEQIFSDVAQARTFFQQKPEYIRRLNAVEERLVFLYSFHFKHFIYFSRRINRKYQNRFWQTNSPTSLPSFASMEGGRRHIQKACPMHQFASLNSGAITEDVPKILQRYSIRIKSLQPKNSSQQIISAW